MTSTLQNSLRDARADLEAYFAGDDSRVVTQTIHVPEDIDVKSVREGLALSQRQFAEMFGFKLSTLQSWERTKSRRRPTRTARVLLTVLQRRPQAVLDALVEHDAA